MLWCGVACAQTPVYPGAIATDSQLKIGVNGVATLLTAQINANQTTIPVSACARIVANVLITIDNEIMPVTGCVGTIMTVGARGFDSTTATAHHQNTQINAYVDAWHHNSLSQEVQAIETALGPNLSNVNGGSGGVHYQYPLPNTVNRTLQSKLQETVSVLDYGADATGVANSATAFQNAWNANPRGTILLPCGTYNIAAKMTFSGGFKTIFQGSGGCTVLNWTGNSTDPMMLVQNCFNCQLSDFEIINTTPLKYGIWQINNGIQFTSTLNEFSNITVQGGGTFLSPTLTTAFYAGGGVDGNNDQMRFTDVHVFGASHSAFTLDNTQVFDVIFEHCSSEATNIGVEGLKGNFSWYDGDMADNFTSDFYIPSLTGGAMYEISNVETENSAQFLNVSNGLASNAVQVKLSRIIHDGLCTGNSAANIIAHTCTAQNGHYIFFGRPGVLSIDNSHLNIYGAGSQNLFFTSAFQNLPSYNSAMLTVSNTLFGFAGLAGQDNSTFGTTIQDIFDTRAGGATPTSLINSAAYSESGAGYVQLGNYSNAFTQNHLGNTDSTVSYVLDGYVQNLVNFNMQAFNTTTGAAAFSGSGLNDLTSGGLAVFPYPSVIIVKIAATGTLGGPDTFVWNENGGAFTSTPTPILGPFIPAQILAPSHSDIINGITVQFANTTGHTVGDQWTITLTQHQGTPVIQAGVNGGVVAGTGSTVGPIQCGNPVTTATTVWPCIDSGNGGAGEVLTATEFGFGFANRSSNTVAVPWFQADSLQGTVLWKPTLFSALSTCSAGLQGREANITDASTQVWGATVAGGSPGTFAKVICDGTNWTVVGK